MAIAGTMVSLTFYHLFPLPTGVRAVTFNGSSSAVGFNMTSNGSVDAELSFDLRTRYTDAVVIEIRDVGDKLIAQIVDGKLSVAYSIGGVTGNVVSGKVMTRD